MSQLRKCIIWYIMAAKRLLYKPSFIVLLLIIPILVISLNSVTADESGVLKIVLCSEDGTADKIINNLISTEGIIKFEVCTEENDAEDAVASFDADAAWIFASDLENKLQLYAKNRFDDPLVEVLEREDTVPLKLSREILYGALFEDISYSLYEDFVYSEIAVGNEIDKEELKEIYYQNEKNGSIVSFSRLDEGTIKKMPNYLTAPVRGLLSLVIVLCGLAAAMYFLSDNKEGKYDWMPPKKRLAPAFALCLSAVMFAAIAVFVAINFSSFSVKIEKEILSMCMCIIMTVGFSMFFCVVFSSPGALGATIPGIMIIMLVLSPIFFNMKILRPVRLTLPVYYYLQSIHNADYYLYGIFYCVGIYALVFIINKLKSIN